MAELPEGTVFAGHRIDGIAGRGGMGVVYRATHLALDHVVALKVITPELAPDPRFRDRFVRESRLAVSIRHPNVVQVRHAGEEDGVLFVTMDYVEGSDLRALINAERRIEPAWVARIIGQVAGALDAAHERGLVHRDVKPGNVLIETRDGDEHVYLTDFGLTKPMTGATELTASGAFIGTLEYMAPEQIRAGELDARTDVYALGGVAFATLTGEPPFGRVEGDVAKLYAHLNDPPPRASERAPGLSPALDPVLQRALAKDPAERYGSAGEFARALEAAVGTGVAPTQEAAPSLEPTTPSPAPEREPTAVTEVGRPPQGRRRALGVLAGLAVVGAVIGVIALTGGDGDEDEGGGGTGGGGAEPARLVEERPAGELPSRVTVAGDRVFVADRDGGAVLSFAAADGAGERQEVGGEIEGIVEEHGTLWAADAQNNIVRRLDPATLEEALPPVEVGVSPGEMATGTGGVWVVNRDGGSLSVIDPGTGSPQTVASGLSYPRALAFGESSLWVATRDGGRDGTGTLVEVDPATREVIDTYDAPGGPHGVIEHKGTVWVTATDTNEVLRFDAATREQLKPVDNMCAEPQGIVFGFERIWVTCSDGTVQPIEPREVRKLDSIPLGNANLEGITVGAGRVWVAGGEGGGLFEIDPGAGV